MAAKIAIGFVLAGALWVLLTDVLLYRVAASPQLVARFETAKGWTFVALTALAIFWFVLRAIRRLASEEAKSRAILDSIAEGVLLLGPDGAIIHANPAAVRMLGAAGQEDLLGLDGPGFSRRFRVTYPDGRLVPPEQFVSQRALHDEQPLSYKAVLRVGGHELVILSSASRVRAWPGTPVLMSVSVMRDVTRLDQLGRLRDQLFAAAAHSLKTPVAVIQAHAQILAGRTDGPVARSAAAIDRQSRRLDGLIQNLLVLARIRSGALRLRPSDVALAPLVEAVASGRDAEVPDVRIALRLDAHPIAFVDEERMTQLVRNLVEGAGRRAPPGTDVLLSLTADDATAEIRTEYQLLDEAVASGIGEGHDAALAIWEELDENTGLRVGRQVIEAIAAAHGGTCGTDLLPQRRLTEWVRVPLVETPGVKSGAEPEL
jgi:signal transduction histidine kinase